MEGKDKLNCWEFMKCPENTKNSCDAFKLNLGKDCWHVPSIELKGCPNRAGSCITCPFFMEKNPKVAYWFKSQNDKW